MSAVEAIVLRGFKRDETLKDVEDFYYVLTDLGRMKYNPEPR